MQSFTLPELFEIKKNDELTAFFALSEEGYGREKSRQKHNPTPQSTYLVKYYTWFIIIAGLLIRNQDSGTALPWLDALAGILMLGC